MTKEAEGTIRLLICDDQAIVCEGLRAMLEPIRHIEVVGVATNGVEAIELTRTTQPDLVLMDLKMPRMNGIQATRAICDQFRGVRILVLTTYNDFMFSNRFLFSISRNTSCRYVIASISVKEV
jgi:YesN/AraC family two-component response regulator